MTEMVTEREFNFSKQAADRLRDLEWAKRLVADFDQLAARGVNVDDKPKLFEVRFAYYLASRGLAPEYECKAGVGDSSVDFFVGGNKSWLLELVSLRPSDAVKKATVTDGNLTTMELSGFKAIQARYDATTQGLPASEIERLVAEAGKESIEGEILRAQRQLGEKVMKNGKSHKFPASASDRVHCIVVDGRGFSDGGDNHSEFKFICTGHTDETLDSDELIYKWQDKPILGIFDHSNMHSGAPAMRERIHVIHFISEEEEHYVEGGIEQASVFFCVNGLLGKAVELASGYPGPLQSRPTLTY
jgi:hypothetical protein